MHALIEKFDGGSNDTKTTKEYEIPNFFSFAYNIVVSKCT